MSTSGSSPIGIRSINGGAVSGGGSDGFEPEQATVAAATIARSGRDLMI